MTPKEILDKIANVEYDNKLTADAFLYMADGGMYPHKLEEIAIEAIIQYHRKQSLELISALLTIAVMTDEDIAMIDEVKKCRDIVKNVIKNFKI